MPKVIVDPQAVRQFARLLDNKARQVQDQQAGLKSQFRALHEVWRDAKYKQFEHLFQDTGVLLRDFLKLAEQYADYLKRKANKGDTYLKSGYR
jgi:uncharacterized protein YukE